jgi:hypothetical protein
MGHGLMGLVGRFGVGSDSFFYFINITPCEFGLSRKKKPNEHQQDAFGPFVDLSD